jgi:hypothetical protein
MRFKSGLSIVFVLAMVVTVTFSQSIHNAKLPPDVPDIRLVSSATQLTGSAAALDQAKRLFRDGRFSEALAQYSSVIDSGTGAAEAYAGLTRVYLKLKRPADSYSSAQNAVALGPLLATAHSALGEADFRRGDIYAAQAEFQFASKHNQADSRSYLGLYWLDQGTSNFKKSKRMIDLAFQSDPDDPQIKAAWVQTRPLPERIRWTEEVITSESNYYSRAEKARFKQAQVLLKDRAEHPERSCSLVNPPDRLEMRLEPVETGETHLLGYGVRTKVNGHEWLLPLANKGGPLLLSGREATKAGVVPIIRVDMNGPGDLDPPEGYAGFADSVQIGGLEFKNCYVSVADHFDRGSTFDRFAGIVSAQMLAPYLVQFDRPRGELVLRKLPPRPASEDAEELSIDAQDPDARPFRDQYTPPEMSGWLQAFRYNGFFLVPADVNGIHPLLLEVAPAYPASYLSLDLAHRALPGKERKAGSAFGANGPISNTYLVGPVRIAFGGIVEAVPTNAALDITMQSDAAGMEISGLIGLNMLANVVVTIDYRDGLVSFKNPKPNE